MVEEIKRYEPNHLERTHYLNDFITQHTQELLRTIRQFVLRSGLAAYGDADQLAIEILNETVVEALAHIERLKTPEAPFAWLIGIALNILKRHQTTDYQRSQREPLLHDLYPSEALTENEIIDQLIGISHALDTDQDHDYRAEVSLLFEHLSPDDAQIIRLAILYDFNGEAIASNLRITAGAARVRLHRALKRVRQFWGTQAILETATQRRETRSHDFE